MRLVIWTDSGGYRRRALIRNDDTDDLAKSGAPMSNIPDLDLLDWEEIKRDLHNLLTDGGLITWSDVEQSYNGLTQAILAVMRKRLIQLYRSQK